MDTFSNGSTSSLKRIPARLLVAGLLLFSAHATQAVIFYSTGDPNYNTSAPTGDFANSGWELQGAWGSFLGTPIAPHYFITARHIGGSVGNKMILNGVEYTTTSFFDDPGSDLRIWRVSGTFPAFAGLYTRSDETGKSLIVFGRGSQRGDAVVVSGLLGSALHGWRWGTPDGRKRWGENQVAEVVSGDQVGNLVATSAAVNNFLRIPFNASGGVNEAHLSDGDSGGAIFIKDGSAWKLAGINAAVDGPYNTANSGAGFDAAIFDEGGLYKGGDGKWTMSPDLPGDTPGAFYATRISSSISWINNILAQSSTSTPPALQSAPQVTGPYTNESSASVDEGSRSISIAPPNGLRFYRLTGSSASRISGISIRNGKLVLSYE